MSVVATDVGAVSAGIAPRALVRSDGPRAAICTCFGGLLGQRTVDALTAVLLPAPACLWRRPQFVFNLKNKSRRSTD